MKKIFLSLTIMAFAFGASAQDTKFGIAANVGLPTEKGYDISYGADLQMDFGLAENLAITGSAGYQSFNWKIAGASASNGFIPVLVGAKFGFGDSNLYGHAQLGYGVGAKKGNKGAFSYAPSIGYNLGSNLDAAVKYLAFSRDKSTLGSVNLRVAYTF